MKALILAAGKGERLGSITEKTPKPMIKISGKPILENNIIMCQQSGITDIIINLHHLAHKITNYFGDGSKWGVNISYSYEESLLGTAGTVNNLKSKFAKNPFLVIYGDNYSNINLHEFSNYHKSLQSHFTIALCKLDDVSQSGVAELGTNGKIIRFIEKPKEKQNSNSWVNAGIYIIEPVVLDEIKSANDFGKEVIPKLIEENFSIYGYKMKNKLIPIDTPRLLKEMNQIK